MEESDRN